MKFKRVSALALIASLSFSSISVFANNSINSAVEISSSALSIPLQMQPGTILTYDDNLNTWIEILHDSVNRNRNTASGKELLPEDLIHTERHAEDLYIQTIIDATKHLPVIDLGMGLPDPSPGLKVMYGDDGQITRYYFDDEVSNRAITPNPNVTLPLGTRLALGAYTWGAYSNTANITTNSLLAQGRFTVYRPGVGGSGTVGSSGKILTTRDVATRRSVDNPRHNTSLEVRATDTNIARIMYKNDIGSMPNTVLDIFFWGWNDPYFGYMYNDNLSFPGRYFCTF